MKIEKNLENVLKKKVFFLLFFWLVFLFVSKNPPKTSDRVLKLSLLKTTCRASDLFCAAPKNKVQKKKKISLKLKVTLTKIVENKFGF